jgi:hypothetical protein
LNSGKGTIVYGGAYGVKCYVYRINIISCLDMLVQGSL